jgi:hypothetical protein
MSKLVKNNWLITLLKMIMAILPMVLWPVWSLEVLGDERTG